jgi:hypothetical protein
VRRRERGMRVTTFALAVLDVILWKNKRHGQLAPNTVEQTPNTLANTGLEALP